MSDVPVAPIDFGQVARQTKAMRGAYASLQSNSYTVRLLFLAQFALTLVCEARGIPQRPTYLELARIPGDSESFEATPTSTDGPATVQIKWQEKGRRATVDFGKLLTLYPFELPRGTRAYIPVERSADGMKLIFRFSKAEFISKRRKAMAHPTTAQEPVQDLLKALHAAASSDGEEKTNG